MVNVDARAKSTIYTEKFIFQILNGKYLASCNYNLVVMCNEIIDAEKKDTVLTKFN